MASKYVGLLCLFLALFAATAQFSHIHRDAQNHARGDCATCLVGHSPVAPPAFISATFHHAQSSVNIDAAETLVAHHLVRVFTIRPPPQA